MNELLTSTMVSLGAELTKLAFKGTANAVRSKIASIKDEDSKDSLRSTYNEIVNELLQERDEAVLLAQSYKSELERVVISNEDIEHLHKTIDRLLEIFKSPRPADGHEDTSKVNKHIENFEQVKELISVDTLKAMQLLGFNFKSAIGEPLTLLLRNLILSKVETIDGNNSLTPEMVDLMKSDTAFKNFARFVGRQDLLIKGNTNK